MLVFKLFNPTASLILFNLSIIVKLLSSIFVTEVITSPTYVFINEYKTHLNNKNSILNFQTRFAHFDFYRLKNKEEFFHRGFLDVAEDVETSCFVEWPEKICLEAKTSFTGKKFVIQIRHGMGVGMRKIKVLEP